MAFGAKPGSTIGSRLAQLREDDFDPWLHSCLCNSTMRRRAQQDGYQQSGAPKRVLFYTGGGNLRRREDESSPSPRMGEPMNVNWLDIDKR